MNENGSLGALLEDVDDFLQQQAPPAVQKKAVRPKTPACYSLDGLNIRGSIPLNRVIRAVRLFRSGKRRPKVDKPRLSMLLSGVPGGGKTAFVEHIARSVGAPLKKCAASDLLSKWIGESEQNLAKAFEDAKAENAILFLDEVDTFLFTRTMAERSWQVSAVNELLQQMENFEGVMIAATNMTSKLDKAALRRFTFKFEFDYLTDEGKRTFFKRYFRTPLSDAERARLDAMECLAPGDFRTVKEKLFYLTDHETNKDRLDALQAEVDMKGRRVAARIGFGT